MDLFHIICSLVVAAGAGIMVACVYRVGEVRGTLALTLEPNRGWLLRRIRIHRTLMGLFLAAYVAVIAGCLFDVKFVSESVMAILLFLSAAFIYLGISIQNRMSHAMLQTIGGLIPMCAWCKRVRTEGGEQRVGPDWETVETYLARRVPVDFTHDICPDCQQKIAAEIRR